MEARERMVGARRGGERGGIENSEDGEEKMGP